MKKSIFFVLSLFLFSNSLLAEVRGMRPSSEFVNGLYIFCGGAIYGKNGGKSRYLKSCFSYNEKSGYVKSEFIYPIEAYNIQSKAIDSNTVLFFGGFDGNDYLKNTYLLDIKTKFFKRVGDLPVGISSHSSVRLVNGEILSVGGVTYAGSIDDIFLFNKNNLNWEYFGKLPSRRHYHATAPLSNGGFIVAGGAVKIPPDGFSNPDLDEIIEFDPRSNFWYSLGKLPESMRRLEILNPSKDIFLILGGETRSSNGSKSYYSGKVISYDYKKKLIVDVKELGEPLGFTRSVLSKNGVAILFGNESNGLSQIQQTKRFDW
jgi:N-acetylneuraminic acid mutarotase